MVGAPFPAVFRTPPFVRLFPVHPEKPSIVSLGKMNGDGRKAMCLIHQPLGDIYIRPKRRAFALLPLENKLKKEWLWGPGRIDPEHKGLIKPEYLERLASMRESYLQKILPNLKPENIPRPLKKSP